MSKDEALEQSEEPEYDILTEHSHVRAVFDHVAEEMRLKDSDELHSYCEALERELIFRADEICTNFECIPKIFTSSKGMLVSRALKEIMIINDIWIPDTEPVRECVTFTLRSEFSELKSRGASPSFSARSVSSSHISMSSISQSRTTTHSRDQMSISTTSPVTLSRNNTRHSNSTPVPDMRLPVNLNRAPLHKIPSTPTGREYKSLDDLADTASVQSTSSIRSDTMIKISIVGNPGCGKTSLLRRFTRGGFSESYHPTYGASSLNKEMTVGHKRVTLQLWDTPGTDLLTMSAALYKDTVAWIIVYDITSKESFMSLDGWIDQIAKIHNGDSGFILAIVGNKFDIRHRRALRNSYVHDWSRKNGIRSFECSAKSNYLVIPTFTLIALTALPKAERFRRSRRLLELDETPIDRPSYLINFDKQDSVSYDHCCVIS